MGRVGRGSISCRHLDASLLAGEVHEEVAAVHVLRLLPRPPHIQGVHGVAVECALRDMYKRGHVVSGVFKMVYF